MKPTFFPTAEDLRKWFERNHTDARELLVGFYKKGSGKPSVTWPESVDEALCFGWIDGVRKSLDENSYTIRFSPRRPGSIWSAVNVKKALLLIEQGRMLPIGLKALEARKENKVGIYSYEQRPTDFDGPYALAFQANSKAWTFFQAQSPSYRRTACWWILSAKTETTRLKRLEKLIEISADGGRLDDKYRR